MFRKFPFLTLLILWWWWWTLLQELGFATHNNERIILFSITAHFSRINNNPSDVWWKGLLPQYNNTCHYLAFFLFTSSWTEWAKGIRIFLPVHNNLRINFCGHFRGKQTSNLQVLVLLTVDINCCPNVQSTILFQSNPTNSLIHSVLCMNCFVKCIVYKWYTL